MPTAGLLETRVGGRFSLIGRSLGVVLVVHLLHATTIAAPSDKSTAETRAAPTINQLHEAVAATLSHGAATAIEDIAISEDGAVRGRVLVDSAAKRPMDLQGTGLCVKFVRGQRAVAIAEIDPEGQFAVRSLPAGFYRVIVEGSGTSDWRFVRLWYAESAPPSARSEIVSLTAKPLTKGIVRGQNSTPFPIMSLRQAAVVTGIAAGAIAAPLIYHNAQSSNRVPASY